MALGTARGRHSWFALARYDEDGTLDPTFGGDGRVANRFGDSPRHSAWRFRPTSESWPLAKSGGDSLSPAINTSLLLSTAAVRAACAPIRLPSRHVDGAAHLVAIQHRRPLFVAAWIVPGMEYGDDFGVLFIAALVFTLVNWLIRPIVILLALPAVVLTFGLALILINTFMLYLTDWIVPSFETGSFWWTLVAAIIVSIVNLILGLLIKPDEGTLDQGRCALKRRALNADSLSMPQAKRLQGAARCLARALVQPRPARGPATSSPRTLRS